MSHEKIIPHVAALRELEEIKSLATSSAAPAATTLGYVHRHAQQAILALKSALSAPAADGEAKYTPTEFVDEILSACDASNWDADLNTGNYFRGLKEAYEHIQEIAIEYQNSMYAATRVLSASGSLGLCEDEGCPHAGTPHVCISRGSPCDVVLCSICKRHSSDPCNKHTSGQGLGCRQNLEPMYYEHPELDDPHYEAPGDVGQNNSDGEQETDEARRGTAALLSPADADPTSSKPTGAPVRNRDRLAPSDPAAPQGQDAALLADRIEQHVGLLAHRLPVSLIEWNVISNDLLNAAKIVRTRAPEATEAVCWLCNGQGDGWRERNRIVFDKESADDLRNRPGNKWTVEPLYRAAPPPAKPVSVETIARKLANFAGTNFDRSINPMSDRDKNIYRQRATVLHNLIYGGGDGR